MGITRRVLPRTIRISNRIINNNEFDKAGKVRIATTHDPHIIRFISISPNER